MPAAILGYCFYVSITQNVEVVRERIAAAAQRAGQNPIEIALMAVSKTFPPESIREAYAAGVRLFGENRVQEFSGKAAALQDLADTQWHMIGHLQSNKAALAARLFAGIDSVDSLKLAEKLDAIAAELGKTLRVLIEINLGGEAAKSGVPPDSEELEFILEAAPRLRRLAVCGLMAIPPFTEEPQKSRPSFRRLRGISERIASRKLPGVRMDVLSMGMSHDFEIAIEEGSTCVRLGTAIFGQRKMP